jgi:hypothetical protein
MITTLHKGHWPEWICCFHLLDGSHEFLFSFLVCDFFVDLVCLAEDVKLNANGRQPTLLTLLLLIFLMLIIQLELCFIFQDRHSCIEVWESTTSPNFFFSPGTVSLYIGDNVSFKFGGRKNILLSCYRYCDCLIMLFLRIWLKFNSYLYFIGKLNMMNTWSLN